VAGGGEVGGQAVRPERAVGMNSPLDAGIAGPADDRRDFGDVVVGGEKRAGGEAEWRGERLSMQNRV
jgi:hypothetical protein